MREGIVQDGIDKRWWDCGYYLGFLELELIGQTDRFSPLTLVDGG